MQDLSTDQQNSIRKIGKPSAQMNLRTITDENEINDFSQGYNETK